MRTTCLPTDRCVLEKMTELANAVRRVPEMHRHIEHFVQHQLFAGRTVPPVTDSRFWPGGKSIMNCIYRAATKARLVLLVHCFTCVVNSVHDDFSHLSTVCFGCHFSGIHVLC